MVRKHIAFKTEQPDLSKHNEPLTSIEPVTMPTHEMTQDDASGIQSAQVGAKPFAVLSAADLSRPRVVGT